jgi:hypothetical protein
VGSDIIKGEKKNKMLIALEKEKWELLANLFLANHRYTREEATLQ